MGNNYDATSKQISIAQNKAIRILYRQKNRIMWIIFTKNNTFYLLKK